MYFQAIQDLSAWGYSSEKLDLYCINGAISFCIKFGPDEAEEKIPYFMNKFRQCKAFPENLTLKRKVLFVLLKYVPQLFDFICALLGKR